MLEPLIAASKSIADEAANILIAFAALGAVTMAIIQAFKELSPLRRRFNERRLTAWLRRSIELGTRPKRAESEAREREVESAVEVCKEALIELATAGDSEAFFTLEADRMAGQINTAAGVVIDFPKGHGRLLQCLAAHASPEDLQAVLEARKPPRPKGADNDAKHEPPKALLEARVRVMHQIQRNIDAFQISTAFKWKTRLQKMAILISMILGTVAVLITRPDGTWVSFGDGLLYGLAAGFIAPIAYDLLAIVNKGRQG